MNDERGMKDKSIAFTSSFIVHRFPFLLHLAHKEIVEAGADDGDGSEFADLIRGGCDDRGEDVRAELEFEREGEIARGRDSARA
jgi:hypothetical protein